MKADAATREQLVRIFSDVFMQPFDPAVPDIKKADVPGWDSISHLRLVMDIEAAYGIALTDEEILEIASLGDVGRLLARRGVDGFSAS